MLEVRRAEPAWRSGAAPADERGGGRRVRLGDFAAKVLGTPLQAMARQPTAMILS